MISRIWDLLGIVMHRVMNRAKSKYQEFDPEQKPGEHPVHPAPAQVPMSQKELASSLNMTPAVNNFCDPEDGAGGGISRENRMKPISGSCGLP